MLAGESFVDALLRNCIERDFSVFLLTLTGKYVGGIKRSYRSFPDYWSLDAFIHE